MPRTDLKMLVLLHANKLFATSSSELSFLNYRNLKQECSVFYSFSCSCIPLYTTTTTTTTNNNNNVHLSYAHQRPERSHDTY